MRSERGSERDRKLYSPSLPSLRHDVLWAFIFGALAGLLLCAIMFAWYVHEMGPLVCEFYKGEGLCH